MEENNNHLGDFLRKKLDDFDESAGSWNAPDPEVRGNILDRITAPAPAAPTTSPIPVIVLVALLQIAAIAYIWYLQNQIGQLESHLKQQPQAGQVNLTDPALVEKYAAEIASLKAENTQLRAAGAEREGREAQLNQQARTQLTTINQLRAENRFLQGRLAERPPAQLDKLPDQPHSTDKKQPTAALALSAPSLPSPGLKMLSAPEQQFPEIALLPTLPITRAKASKRWEAGYDFALLRMDIPQTRSFKNQRLASENTQNNRVTTAAHGLSFAYSPAPHWWIRTGLRTATINHQSRSRLGLAYNRTNESDLPNGDKANELTFTTRTAYSETRGAFNITLERGAELEEGDLLEITIRDQQRLQYLQAPFEIAYFSGAGRLQWMLRSGLQWNQLSFGDYTFTVFTEARGRPILVNRGRVLSQDIPVRHFISAQAGLGLNYRLFGQLYARASANYSYQFINHNHSDISGSANTGADLTLGLHYRF